MITLHPARRRADRFAELVDGLDTRRGDGLDAATTELLELVGALRSAPEARPRPEFVSDLRAQLMAAAETELAPATPGQPSRGVDDRLTVTPRRRGPRERRLAVAAGAFAVVAATTSMAVASQSALPGDALYPLKRAIEDTHTSLSFGDQAKGSTMLHNAGDRLTEARDLSRGGDGDAGRITDTLQTFTSQTRQGSELLMQDYRENGDTRAINELRDFDAASIVTLSSLDGVVPEGAQSALVDAARQVFLIDAAAGQLCPDCTSTGITEIPPTLLSSGAVDQPTPGSPGALDPFGVNGLFSGSGGGSGGGSGQGGGGGGGAGGGTTTGGGGQVLPSDPVSIPTELLSTAVPTPAASTGVLGGVLGGLTGQGGGGRHSPRATPTVGGTGPSLGGAASAAASAGSAAGSAAASAVGSAVGTAVGGPVGGAVSSAAASAVGGVASGVGTLVNGVGGAVGGLTGSGQGGG